MSPSSIAIWTYWFFEISSNTCLSCVKPNTEGRVLKMSSWVASSCGIYVKSRLGIKSEHLWLSWSIVYINSCLRGYVSHRGSSSSDPSQCLSLNFTFEVNLKVALSCKVRKEITGFSQSVSFWTRRWYRYVILLIVFSLVARSSCFSIAECNKLRAYSGLPVACILWSSWLKKEESCDFSSLN